MGAGIKMKLLIINSIVMLIFSCSLPKLDLARHPAQKVNTGDLLEKLRSGDDSVRIDAFDQLRSDPANLKSPAVQAALLDLLDRERQKNDSDLLEAQKKGYPDEGDNSDWAEYYSDLYGVVESFADWSDPRQACILVDANPSDDAPEIADHAGVTVPCLITRSESTVSMIRAVAVPVLVQALTKASDTLDANTVQVAKNIIFGALQDPDDGVRSLTVLALGRFGSEDMIPALKKVAETDPAPEEDGHSIRQQAAAAIAAIQKRAAGKDEPQVNP